MPTATAARVAISAHRSGTYRHPATYDTYRAAISTGAEYIEIDIRRTADGALVVYHDARCGEYGPEIAELGYLELCDRVGYTVPYAGEVMRIIAGRAAGHLDLKAAGYEDEAVKLAVEAFGPSGFVATTLEDVSVARISRTFPEVRTALSLGRDLAGLPAHTRTAVRLSEIFPVRRLRACGARWAAFDYRLTRAGVLGRCAAHGIGTMLWTVDGDRTITRFLKDPRVDVLITNRPARARALRDALPSD